MFGAIAHQFRVLRSIAHETVKRHGRSSKWPGVEHAWLKQHGGCAACGSKKRLQVHHVQPFHLHPELELDVSNLLTLCMDVKDCHLLVGHGGSFAKWNPNVVDDAAHALHHPLERPLVVQRAKASRRT